MSAPDVAERLAAVHARIAAVERPFTHAVDVVAVTKGFTSAAVRSAVFAGCTAVGENYAQELLTKRDVLTELQPSVHFIGRLQSNKVRSIAALVSLWETLDRPSVIKEVAKRAPGARVLIQVNATGEAGKGGCDPAEAGELVTLARAEGLVVEGLMTVGPTDGTPADAEPGFRVVRALVDELGLATCSMGMTADLDVAVAAGATQVRVGTALFGPRPAR
ncbi:MAG: YggS family pyridoxal phosphate-dependent enzyme [Ilumatobacter sp.]|nr:YggS family pyridoxal phosphate-dependent enzyme [Ilumatobacter sp.]